MASEVIGKASVEELKEMARRGYSPQQAVEAIIAEAKRRYPRADTVIVQPGRTHNGFDIIAL